MMHKAINKSNGVKNARLMLFVVALVIILRMLFETLRLFDCGIATIEGERESHQQKRSNATFSSSTLIKLAPLHEVTRSNQDVNCSHPLLFPVHDRIANTSQLPHQKIPRVIHVAWIRGFPSNETRCLPYDFVKYTERWKKQFPSYSFYFHDDQAVDWLFQQAWPEFPQLRKLMDTCVQFNGAIKIDIWRALVLYRYGGFYSDIDAAPSISIGESMVDPLDSAFFLSDKWNRPSQGMQGMEPKHPIAYYTVYEIMDRLFKMEDISQMKPVFITGPDALKHGYGKALGWPKDLFKAGVHKGNNEKQVRKIGRDVGWLDVFNLEQDDVVVWNERENVTKRERVDRLLKTEHWKRTVSKRKGLKKGNCMDNLFHSEMTQINKTRSGPGA